MLEEIKINTILPEKWQEYYKLLLVEHKPEYNTISHNVIQIQGESIMISMERTRKAITLLKNGRAPGLDGIPAELIKNGTNYLTS